MRRLPAIAAVSIALAAAAPAGAALAASYTVRAGGGACGDADTTCGSLTIAGKAMRSGDAVTIAPGRYEESPRFEAPGVVVRGSARAPGVVVAGTVTFAGGAGARASVLQRLVVSATATGAAAVVVGGTAGVSVRDASLFSASGSALAVPGAAGVAVTRSRLLAGTAAIAVGGGSLKLDSSILSGGAGASGAGIALLPAPQYALVAPASIVGRHVTIAGAPAAIAPATATNVAARFSDSIVLGAAPAGLAFTRTDRASAPQALFVNPQTRNFRLKPGSPALDRGQITPGDSKTDIDGQPRTLGKASDLGADELDTVAPRVTITRPRAGRPLSAGSRLRLAGRAQDPSGVATVVFSLEVLPRSGGTCRWFHPVRALVTRSCSDPVLVRAGLAKGGTWSYRGPRSLRLPAGRYRVRVAGTDRAGVTGNSAPRRRAGVTFAVRSAAAAP